MAPSSAQFCDEGEQHGDGGGPTVAIRSLNALAAVTARRARRGDGSGLQCVDEGVARGFRGGSDFLKDRGQGNDVDRSVSDLKEPHHRRAHIVGEVHVHGFSDSLGQVGQIIGLGEDGYAKAACRLAALWGAFDQEHDLTHGFTLVVRRPRS